MYNPEEDKVELKSHDLNWSKQAEDEIAVLRKHLPFSWIKDIQHIGSTAISDIKAKPLIDIMIGVEDLQEAKLLIPIVESLGYQFWPDNPKKDRLFFVKGMPPFGKQRTHHIHVFEINSFEWFARQAFRDYLKSHELDKSEYEKLKEDLAKRFTYAREAYTEAKTHFIKEVVKKAVPAWLHFKLLENEDFPVLRKWFNLEHVQTFYSLHHWTLEAVQKKFIDCITGKEPISCFIMYLGKQPIGYIQKYALKDYPWTNQEFSSEVILKAAGIDLFIGEKDFLNRGIAKIVVKVFLAEHVWPFYQYCVVDPDIRNTKSLNFFESLGFQNDHIIQSKDAMGREVSLQLMIKERVAGD